ncbi:hypothetical protein AAFN60_10780 [Roseibacillus persicicus]|uniref:hypothetical protein n=1 Tax=Roseibacillus persicicus TaxID=454148 RepID=UPI00398A87D0
MNVRDLTIELRPRSSWEAVDLGTALAKRYYRNLFKMGFKSFGPFYVLVAMLCWKLPFLLPLVIWWCKPLMDRFYLYYLSRRIFGQEVSVKETLGEWKRLLFKGSFSLLTWRRFSWSRSQSMPVMDLEGLEGSARSQRCGVISRDGGGPAFLITVGGMLLEALGLLSIFVMARLFIPQGEEMSWDAMVVWFGRGGAVQTLLVLFFGLGYGLLVLLLEPFYLAGGFALYLNSRTGQEAWDVELRFRELAARVSKTRLTSEMESDAATPEPSEPEKPASGPRFQSVGSDRSLALAISLGLLALFSAPEARAQADPQVVIEEVLADEAFKNHIEKYQEWVPNKKKEEKPESDRGPNWGGGSAVPGAAGAVDGIFKLIGILALSLLVVALIVLIVNLVKGRRISNLPEDKNGKRKRALPTVVMGMEVTPESLPDDLLGQARHHWASGEPRLALSLLYRGALTKLIIEQAVAIESSDTEMECLNQVENVAPNLQARYFRQLSKQWMKIAYSKEEVAPGDFENLCTSWPFEGRSI